MKKLLVASVAILLATTVYATGPGGDPGATGSFSEYLSASESNFTTWVHLYRSEYADGHGYGYVQGYVDGTFFYCQFGSDENLLTVDGDAKGAVIHVDPEAIEYCWGGWLPAPVTFNCKASGYMESMGVSNYESSYFDGYEYKAHTRYARNAVDCVGYIGDDIVLDANSGVVYDGVVLVEKYIRPNTEQEE